MEGPRRPGYYASVTGDRPPGERRGLPPPGEPVVGPVALYGQVQRYGPKQAKLTYGARVLLGLRLPDIEVAWEGPHRRVPADVMSPEWTRISNQCMREAETEARKLNRLDPQAKGLRR